MRCDSSKTFFIMTTDHIEKEQNVNCTDNESDISSDNTDNFSTFVPLPSLSENKSIIYDEFNNEFLHLTTMVRTVYLSYLYKCLLSNYTTCYTQSVNDVPNVELKKYADQMELHAVQLALDTCLYRQNMLKMIADVKSHTTKKKAYKKLVIFLETPKDRIDIGVQTDDTWMDTEETNIENVSLITPNCEKSLQITSPTNSNNFCEERNAVSDEKTDTQMLDGITKEESNDASQKYKDQIDSSTMDIASIKNEDENSQDSLLQHMQDMFCESDESDDDLTRLIEKHSGITKAHVDNEINKMCLEADNTATSSPFNILIGNNVKNFNIAKLNTNDGKISLSRYKEMRRKNSIKLKGLNANETIENKRKQKKNAVWFVEHVHQVSKLKSKMTELSLKNYRRHGRVKEKFLQLFGEFEEEESMPDSPICIEEHLPACKERIAPWIVKYLMPFYKKRRIKDRQLFKAAAKYIADMLILENTFPEQECVKKYIEHYFKNKRTIKTKQNIYL